MIPECSDKDLGLQTSHFHFETTQNWRAFDCWDDSNTEEVKWMVERFTSTLKPYDPNDKYPSYFLKEILLFEDPKWKKDINSSLTTKPQETQSKNWLRHGKTPPWRRHTEETQKGKMNIQYHFLLGQNPNHNEISPYNRESDLYHQKKWEQVSVSMRVHRRRILIHCWYANLALPLWKTMECFKKWNIAQHWSLCSVNFFDHLESPYLIFMA